MIPANQAISFGLLAFNDSYKIEFFSIGEASSVHASNLTFRGEQGRPGRGPVRPLPSFLIGSFLCFLPYTGGGISTTGIPGGGVK